MSQKNPSDGGQKGFAVGRGLLAAAETLNFSMNEQRSGPPNRQMGGMVSGMGAGGGDGQDRGSQLPRRGGGSNLGSTMKLFASLGLSPADLDALAQIPEENISVETLPHILMQLKSRKGDPGDRRMAGNSRDLPSMSSETSYRGGREDWEDMPMGRMGGHSMGQSSARAPPPEDFGYGSMQDVPSTRGYDLDYGNNNGSTGGRERQYSELSRHDSYGGLGMGSSSSNSVFMQRRIGSPSHGKIQDFLGVLPSMFPHVCSLCDFDVHSNMEWNQHTNGLRHAENRRLLLQMYPDWDPAMAQNRSIGSLLEMPNLSPGLLGPAPMSTGHSSGGMPFSWGGGGGGGPGLSGKNQPHSGQPKLRSRVVVAKYDRKPLSNKSLFILTEPFGKLRKHLVLKNKAFLEFETHQEASDMVNYYQQKPGLLYGKPVTFYLSKELMMIEGKDDRTGDRPIREMKGPTSQVVFFSNLPREEEKKMELLTIARRFGNVEKHLFLTEEAFVQLGTPEDAEMLVKYYTQNPLTVKGRSVRLNICTKYKTLNVNRRVGQGGSARVQDSSGYGGDSRGRKSSSSTTTSGSSSANKSSKSSSSKTTSSSYKSKEDKKKEEATPVEDKTEAGAGPGEEVSGVIEGDGGEEQDECEGTQATDSSTEKKTEEDPSAETEQTESKEPAQDTTEVVPESDDGIPEENILDGNNVPQIGGDGADGDGTDGDGADGDGRDGDAVETVVGSETEGQTEVESGPPGTEGATEEPPEAKDDQSAEPEENPEMAEGDLPEDLEGMDQDFLENMDDFVTLDELAEDEEDSHTSKTHSIDNTKRGGLRVVNISGFKRGYGFLNELLALAKPFGKVVKHLVLDLRPEAYLQFETEDEARAMARFYHGNVTASVCGRAVRINHSLNYPTIQCGISQVVYIGQIPNVKYQDEELLKIAEPFGQMKKYFVNRMKRECFIEMANAEDAEKMADSCKLNPLKMRGKRLTVYVSRKYKQLKYGHIARSTQDKKTSKRDSSSSSTSSTTPSKSSKHSEEPPAKKSKEETAPVEVREEKEEKKEKKEKKEEAAAASAEVPSDKQESAADPETETPPEGADQPTGTSESQNIPDAKEKREDEEMEASTSQEPSVSSGENGQTPAETKPAAASLPLAPYDANNPIGVEYVKMGYYCRVCFLFYSNEETAKKVHCSSQAHYDKLKKHLEKEKTPGNKKAKSVAV